MEFKVSSGLRDIIYNCYNATCKSENIVVGCGWYVLYVRLFNTLSREIPKH